MRIYITKYALSTGVKVFDNAKEERFNYGTFASVDGKPCNYRQSEYCTTRQEAIKRVERMKARRISSLEKTIEKVRQIDPEEMVAAAESMWSQTKLQHRS